MEASEATGRTVQRAELERCLAELRAETRAPLAGVYGPDSETWRIARHAVIFLGAGRASLLQLAHPFVAHAIARQSETRKNPLKRFLRTFERVYAMVFGSLEEALGAAERVYRVHGVIHGPIDEDVGRFTRGSRYDANDREAVLWVHATLVHSARQVYELVVEPLSRARRERHYQESKRFAKLFGLGDDDVPRDVDAFDAWFDETLASDLIAVGDPAREIGGFLLAGPIAAAKPIAGWYRVMTAGLLPEKLRVAFGLPFGTKEQRTFERALATLRRLEPALPGRLRFVPAWHSAMRRAAPLRTDAR